VGPQVDAERFELTESVTAPVGSRPVAVATSRGTSRSRRPSGSGRRSAGGEARAGRRVDERREGDAHRCGGPRRRRCGDRQRIREENTSRADFTRPLISVGHRQVLCRVSVRSRVHQVGPVRRHDVHRADRVPVRRVVETVCRRTHDAPEEEGDEEKPGRTGAGPVHERQRERRGSPSRGLGMPGCRVGSRCRPTEQQRMSEGERRRGSVEKRPSCVRPCYSSDAPSDLGLTGPISCLRSASPAVVRGCSRSVCGRGISGPRPGIGRG